MTKEINNNADRNIVTIRIFNAPREIVFSAWTNPELLKQWWGPKGFTNTFHQFNLRNGGCWKFIMHGPDGGNYPNESVFVEIKTPEKIVLDHISKPHFRLTASFEEVDTDKTKLIFEQLFPTVEEYNKVKGFAIDANEENMDRLEDLLQKIIGTANPQP
jgi:uncharacterized protein YndB with AHSA1/START domain